ncbi:hypothetical protein [Oceanobacillus halophilus]|nr:hypothetical protein [Oceanobacillus halophilus]
MLKKIIITLIAVLTIVSLYSLGNVGMETAMDELPDILSIDLDLHIF